MPKPQLKPQLQDGQVLIGTWLNAASPEQVETIGYAGFDFVILDTEHSSYDLASCENLVRAADAAKIPSLIRVMANEPVHVAKALEYGAQGIVVPHVSSGQEAENTVRNAHFAPRGHRGAAPTIRAAHYGQLSWNDYLAYAAKNTLTVVQIEGADGVTNLGEIMAVEGVDVIFIGTFDLSDSLGISGQLDHPLLLETVGDVVQQARANNVAVGMWMPTPDKLGPWIEKGVQLVTVASNDMIFGSGCSTYLDQVRKQIPSIE